MYKLPSNPLIAELTASTRKRRLNLSDLTAPIIEGKKGCLWCQKHLTGRQQKWCSPECSVSGFAWANPQKEEGLHVLLARQEFKCLGCQFDYMPFVTDSLKYLNRTHVTVDPAQIHNKISKRLMKILKYKTPTENSPEVDHVVPIKKGGQSIGFDNHQALCYRCHKNKSKLDNSGPRKKTPK